MDAEKYRLPTALQNYLPHSKAFGNNKTVSYNYSYTGSQLQFDYSYI